MGGAFTALADDASAASFNPAGLALLIEPELSLVGELHRRSEASTDFVNLVCEDTGCRPGGTDRDLFGEDRFVADQYLERWKTWNVEDRARAATTLHPASRPGQVFEAQRIQEPGRG